MFNKLTLPKLKPRLPHAFSGYYALTALFVLIAAATFTSILGAKLNLHNSDQLADPYLFSSHSVFMDATFPGQHTFLIKWPIFWLISLMGFSSFAFSFFTVTFSLATVLALAYLLYKIDKRPLVFGTLCLALACVLLSIPTAPYAGAILPLDLAMLTTRNLEYVLFMVSLYCIARSSGLKDRYLWLGSFGLGLLIAGDKLFAALSIGAAILGLTYYALRHKWQQANLSANWLVAGVCGFLLALIMLAAINASGLTHIANQASGSPYMSVHGPKDLALGIYYGILGLATNFGANPAYGSVIAKQVPSQFAHGLLGLNILGYLINIFVLFAGVYSAYWLIILSAKKSSFYRLGMMLVWSSAAAVVVFVGSTHYYAVDARYLGIALFSGFCSIGLYVRARKYDPRFLVVCGGVIMLAVALGFISTYKTYGSQRSVLASTSNSNSRIVQALQQHKVGVLVGDYWRVFPIRQQIRARQTILPLDDCTHARSALSSRAWNVDLRSSSFAYILSVKKGLTDYPTCKLSNIIGAYGRPNGSVVISGSIEKPEELLLFYDHGANASSPAINPSYKDPATVTPISTDELPYTNCDGPTIMNIVAHQDDDLIFMNPDTQHDISAGHCIRTIYITAGDAGSGSFYWLGREQGSEAAYSTMTGSNNIWVQRLVKLNDKQYVSVANPRGNSKTSLIFLHLPDGNLKGDGFVASRYESLAKLEAGKIAAIHGVDGHSAYSQNQLVAALATLMHLYQPTEIRTQASDTSAHFPDHADHIAAGRIAQQAYKQYEGQQFEDRIAIPIKFYMGYPIHDLSENVSAEELAQKERTFFAYSAHDLGTCKTMVQCDSHDVVYGAYLRRQYALNPSVVQMPGF